MTTPADEGIAAAKRDNAQARATKAQNRHFYQYNRSWYAETITPRPDFIDEVMLGTDAGEIAIRWHAIGNDSVPCLEAFDDSWAMLAAMPDLIKLLADMDNKNVTPDEMVAGLIALGFDDQTKEVQE